MAQTTLKGKDKSNQVLITAENAEGRRKTVPFFSIFRVFRAFRGLRHAQHQYFLNSNSSFTDREKTTSIDCIIVVLTGKWSM
jgi:hypothetical protein